MACLFLLEKCHASPHLRGELGSPFYKNYTLLCDIRGILSLRHFKSSIDFHQVFWEFLIIIETWLRWLNTDSIGIMIFKSIAAGAPSIDIFAQRVLKATQFLLQVLINFWQIIMQLFHCHFWQNFGQPQTPFLHLWFFGRFFVSHNYFGRRWLVVKNFFRFWNRSHFGWHWPMPLDRTDWFDWICIILRYFDRKPGFLGPECLRKIL